MEYNMQPIFRLFKKMSQTPPIFSHDFEMKKRSQANNYVQGLKTPYKGQI